MTERSGWVRRGDGVGPGGGGGWVCVWSYNIVSEFPYGSGFSSWHLKVVRR